MYLIQYTCLFFAFDNAFGLFVGMLIMIIVYIFLNCLLMPSLLFYIPICYRERAVINVVRTCSPTPLFKE